MLNCLATYTSSLNMALNFSSYIALADEAANVLPTPLPSIVRLCTALGIFVVVVRAIYYLTSRRVALVPCPTPFYLSNGASTLPEQTGDRKGSRSESPYALRRRSQNGKAVKSTAKLDVKRRCLVTGGCGYLGTRVVHALADPQDDRVGQISKPTVFEKVIVVDILKECPEEFLRYGSAVKYYSIDLVAAAAGDIAAQESLNAALAGVDTVFHMAGIVRLDRQFNMLYNLHVSATVNLLNSCRSAGVQRFIHTSSVAVVVGCGSEVLENITETHPLPALPASDYAKTKAMGEEKVLAASSWDFHVIVLRPALIYGRDDPLLIRPLLRGGVPMAPPGGAQRFVLRTTLYISSRHS